MVFGGVSGWIVFCKLFYFSWLRFFVGGFGLRKRGPKWTRKWPGKDPESARKGPLNGPEVMEVEGRGKLGADWE